MLQYLLSVNIQLKMNVHHLLTEMWEHFSILQIFDTALNFYNVFLTSTSSKHGPKNVLLNENMAKCNPNMMEQTICQNSK